MNQNETAIGIDLGISYSVACVYKDGKPIIIPSAERNKEFPSYVAFSEDCQILVGEPAKKQATSNPENTISEIKRKMGTDYKVTLNGEQYSPQEILAFILQKIKRDAETFLGEPINKAVITVPPYFDDNQRIATKDAGTLAGIEVLRLVTEPTAACLAYLTEEQNEDINILVFDLGGGTLEITIIEYYSDIYDIQSISGDTSLGTTDITNILMKHLTEDFEKETGIKLNDEQSFRKLRNAANQAIIDLSKQVETEVNIPFIAMDENGPKTLQTKITQSEFKSMLNPFLKKLNESIKRALTDAEISANDIDKIILIGKGSRIPIIQNHLEELIGKPIEKGIDPSECVAIGAAKQAEIILDYGPFSDLLIDPVSTFTISIRTPDGTISQVIDRDSKLPYYYSEIFTTTYDNQVDFSIDIFIGENKKAYENIPLGTLILTNIPPAPKGERKINVKFEIDIDGILIVTAQDVESGTEQSISITKFGDIPEKIREYDEILYNNNKQRMQESINNLNIILCLAQKYVSDYSIKLNELDLDEIESLLEKLKKELEK